MPFSGNTYTNVSGATTAVAGNIVQSAVWDNIHTDLGTALTQLMSQLTTGISYRNALFMNGGMEVWQRGAGAAANIAVAASILAYTADRWYLQTGANQAHTVATVGPGLSNGSGLAAIVQRTAAQTGTTAMVFAYPLDTDEIVRLRGNKVSFTALVKAGANWSPTNGTLVATLFLGTGTVQKRNATPYTGETSAFAISTNLTPGGATTTITGSSSAVVPATTTQAELQFSWTPVGTAGGADTITIDDVQVESQLSTTTWTPTTFDRIPFWDCFKQCQNHYSKTFPYGVAPAQTGGIAGALGLQSQGNIKIGAMYSYPQKMRVTASITTFNVSAGNANWRDVTAAADIVVSVDPSNANLSDDRVFISGATVAATDHLLYIHVTASAGI